MGRAVTDNQMLLRIASILLLLADVAMRASCATPASRRRVLVMLFHAETVAFRHALDSGIAALSPVRSHFGEGGEQAAAINLAHRFCVLALMLQIVATRSGAVGKLPFLALAPTRIGPGAIVEPVALLAATPPGSSRDLLRPP